MLVPDTIKQAQNYIEKSIAMKNVIDANELGNRSRMGTNFMSSFMDTEMAKGKY